MNAACDCLVCIAERIGDMVLEDYPSHRRWRDDRDHAEAVERDYL